MRDEGDDITIGGQTFTAEEFAELLDAVGPIHPLLLAEAIASTALDRDPAARTYPLDDVLREADIDPESLDD